MCLHSTSAARLPLLLVARALISRTTKCSRYITRRATCTSQFCGQRYGLQQHSQAQRLQAACYCRTTCHRLLAWRQQRSRGCSCLLGPLALLATLGRQLVCTSTQSGRTCLLLRLALACR